VFFALLALAAAPPPELEKVVTEARDVERLWAHAEKTIKRAAADAESRSFLRFSITENLKQKAAAQFRLAPAALERTVIDYEAFKFQTYLSSGVFPKRYFGYFDKTWDTAEYEKSLVGTVRAARITINERQKARGSSTMVTDAEIAVTFIAEGGAILLRENQKDLENIHPVFGVGLDDIAIGFDQYRDLVATLDEELGTGLGELVARDAQGNASLTRMMTFREAILGTAVMWIYEKELAAKKLRARDKKELSARSVTEQFIIGSLVYNSGILFSDDRVRMVERFASAEYLAEVSKKNAKSRWPLPLFPVKDARRLLLAEDYPEQMTSWNAIYHILQRYGGYVALHKFTDVFDETGAFRSAR
jgi:hypothetical protein